MPSSYDVHLSWGEIPMQATSRLMEFMRRYNGEFPSKVLGKLYTTADGRSGAAFVAFSAGGEYMGSRSGPGCEIYYAPIPVQLGLFDIKEAAIAAKEV